MGAARHYEGNPKDAIQYLEKALAIFRETKDRYSEGAALYRLSRAHHALGQTGTAIRANQESLDIAQSLHDLRGQASALRHRAEIEYSKRDLTAALQHLDQMPAKLRLHRGTHFAGFERVHRALELGHGIAGRKPAEIAAAAGARVFGVHARDRREIGLVLQTLFEPQQAVARLVLRYELVGLHQNVPGMRLLHDHRCPPAASFVQSQNMKAVGAAQYGAQFPRPQRPQCVGEQGG